VQGVAGHLQRRFQKKFLKEIHQRFLHDSLRIFLWALSELLFIRSQMRPYIQHVIKLPTALPIQYRRLALINSLPRTLSCARSISSRSTTNHTEYSLWDSEKRRPHGSIGVETNGQTTASQSQAPSGFVKRQESQPDRRNQRAEDAGDGLEQEIRAKRHAKLELKWLTRDEIHARVKELLQTDPKKAEAMVRLYSRTPNEAVTAWNVLIDAALKGDPPKYNLAFTLYNDV
jgi:hypothetical protein